MTAGASIPKALPWAEDSHPFGVKTTDCQGFSRRFALILATLLLTASGVVASPPAAPDSDVLAAAEQAFAEGVTHRDDSAKARPAFAQAAAAYDELWQRGHRDPDLALNRANARRLAGNLPGAIAALNEGLAVARWDRPLQIALEDARSAVGYPLVGDLATQCRPAPSKTIGTRLPPSEAWPIAALLWLLACGGVARFVMTRSAWWLVFVGVWLAALALFGGLWLQDYRQRQRENAEPLVVVADDVILRRGNADTYPMRLDVKLPKGVEARELTHRGGWVQIRLASGVVGWLPEPSVLRTSGE
jgi:hypothetical protein